MVLEELFRGIDIVSMKGICGGDDIRGIASDTAHVTRGRIFVCLKGMRFDGHELVGKARENGAAAVVVERDRIPDGGIPYIEVSDTRKALAWLWYNFYGRPCENGSPKLIAVTGTNGKTTTTELIAHILRRAEHTCATIGTLNGAMTTPDPDELYRRLAAFAREGIEYVVMEASSHALALSKLEPLTFEAAVFTNLTPEHLDFHGTMDEYFRAKSLLFGKCRHAFINADDRYGRRIEVSGDVTAEYYSLEKDDAEYRACEVSLKGTDGACYTLCHKNGRLRINTPMLGEYAVCNTLAASACALGLGIPQRVVIDANASFEGVDGRLERVKLDDAPYTVFIDFAHTPDALEKTLRLLRTLTKHHLIVLFGCGGDRDRSKRREMGAAASRLADLTIVTGDNSRSEEPGEIIAEILKGIDRERPYKVIEDRQQAIDYAVNNAAEGDIILLAGKGHERYITDKNGRRAFDERLAVRLAAEKYRRSTDR